MASEPTPAAGTPSERRLRTERARLVAVAIVAAVVTLFAVLNLDQVKVHLLFGTRRLPLIVVIVVCLLIGLLVGVALGRRGGRAG